MTSNDVMVDFSFFNSQSFVVCYEKPTIHNHFIYFYKNKESLQLMVLMVLNSVLKTPDYPYTMICFPEISGLGKGSIKLYSFI